MTNLKKKKKELKPAVNPPIFVPECFVPAKSSFA